MAKSNAQLKRKGGPDHVQTSKVRNIKGEGSHRASSTKNHALPSAASLHWKAADIPTEATANLGESDADFYQGFSFDDEDYLGLTELDGVDVVKTDDGQVQFVQTIGAKKGKEKQVDVVPNKKRKLEQESNGDIRETSKEENSHSSEWAEELPPVSFESDEEEDSDTSELNVEANDGRDSGLQADFKVLMRAEDPLSIEYDDFSVRWSNKELRESLWSDVSRDSHILFSEKKLPAWKKLNLPIHPRLYTSLESLKFTKPTEIQASCLPLSLTSKTSTKDVVGIAQTGSGKTLAYSLPILHWIASNSVEDRQMQLMEGMDDTMDQGLLRLGALILTPTRELALQVQKHIQTIIAASSHDDKQRWASVTAVTGGISEEKQRRHLQGYSGRGVDIIVATPGRLWDICKSDDRITRRIKTSRFLVVDEADRMIENGHFAEMEHLLGLVRRASRAPNSTARVRGGADDTQTFIYSATLSKDLQYNLKRPKRSNNKRLGPGSTLDDLIEAIDFRDEQPSIVDLSTSTRIASSVIETKCECLVKDKDLYLYYFLLRYPGRSLLFVNSIDGIRRLQPLLSNLGVSVQPLHSHLQQKQRLKNLERFRSSKLPKCNQSVVLLATDVAARGLDIPAVDHVIHFQLPRSVDTYVHRSGRTGRAGQSGVSLALIEPGEKRLWRDTCRALKRST